MAIERFVLPNGALCGLYLNEDTKLMLCMNM